MMAPETVVTVEHNKPTQQQTPSSQQQGGALDWIKINIEYFKTPPGILKIIQLILGILCMALATPHYSVWFVFVAVASFITTIMWTLVYFLSIREALKLPINWILSELISVATECLFYFIAMIVLFVNTSRYYDFYFHGSNVAAAVFGLFQTLAYAASAFFLWMDHKNEAASS